MKYSHFLAVAVLLVPAVASAKSGCSVRDSNSTWTYYSVATGESPYTIACSLTIAAGNITAGQCTSDDGSTFTATGTISVANPDTSSGGGDGGGHHRIRPATAAFMKKNPTVCTVTGEISYPDLGLTETLTNLTLNHARDEIVGVGTNDTDLISVTFVNNR